MEFEGDSLDDVLIKLYGALPAKGKQNSGTRGDTLELIGVTLRIGNPRARLSRSASRGKPFSALGELLWYLSGRNDLCFIKPYVRAYEKDADKGVIHGGYGPRLLAMRGAINQVDNVVHLLSKRPSTRRAVIQLFNAEDIASTYKEVPCTTTMQFFQRHGTLHMTTTLRSNDAYLGLPHDIFCFTMLQEMIARRLGVEPGEYVQFIGSMHVYTEHLPNLPDYIGEGYQKVVAMPAMPMGDPFKYVQILLDCEHRARNGEEFDASAVTGDVYWADLGRLLQAFWKSRRGESLDELGRQFENPIYREYLEARRAIQRRHTDEPEAHQ